LGDVQNEPFDLLLETGGGMTDATESVVKLLSNLNLEFRVIVSHAAKSNGTLLCLAAKSIVMGVASELGPIEPLINNIPCSILIQQQIAQQNFSLHKLGEYALQQTRTLATTLLTAGMMKDRPNDVAGVVQKLASRDVYFSHGSAIDHLEATALGLRIEYLPPDNPIWQRAWLLYCMYDHDCRKDRLFKIFEGRARSTAIAVPPLVPVTPK
jgi:Serine dehydrogenase proteinase